MGKTLSIVLFGSLAAATTHAVPPQRDSTRYVYANFTIPAIESICDVETNVWVYASESQHNNLGGPPTSYRDASVSIYQYDSCTYETLLSAYGYMAPSPSELAFDKNGGEASLDVLVHLVEWNDADGEVLWGYAQVNLDWKGSGPQFRSHGNNHYSGPAGYSGSSHYRGMGRAAVASGRITAALLEVNQDSDFAEIGSSTSAYRSK